jgi:homogentisate 1,2-dioxygenase
MAILCLATISSKTYYIASKGIPMVLRGAMERSIGHTETHELAVMVDTFRPLMVTEEAMGLDDGQYYKSWVE